MAEPWNTERIQVLVEGLTPDADEVSVQFRIDDEGPHLCVGLRSQLTTADRMRAVLERVLPNTRVEVVVAPPKPSPR